MRSFGARRLYAMLQDMRQAPALPDRIPRQPLLITAGLAMTVEPMVPGAALIEAASDEMQAELEPA